MVKADMFPGEWWRPMQRWGWPLAAVLAPALVAASRVDSFVDAGGDLRAIRAVGLGYTGGFRALDGWLASLFALVPIGTRALRAQLVGVAMVALVAALLFALVRRLLDAVAGQTPWSGVVAAMATSAACLALSVQGEAVVVGSGLTGVALVLAAVWLTASREPRWPWVVAVATLALSYDPVAGACAVVGAVTAWLCRAPAGGEEPSHGRDPQARLAAGLAALLGLVPFCVAAVFGRVGGRSTGDSLLSPADGGGVAWSLSGLHHGAALVRGDVGDVLVVLAGVGLLVALSSRGARSVGAPLVALVAAAGVAMAIERRAPRGGVGLSVLVAVVAVVALAAVAMHEAVVRVARAKLPLASASAAMIVLLEAAVPARLADDALAQGAAPGPRPLAAWEDAAVAGLPLGSTLLVSTPALYTRWLATEVTGDLPGDLTLLPSFDPSHPRAAEALAHDGRLVPLLRDLALHGTPQELSLSTVAAARPLVVTPDPRWARPLMRHLVPLGLLSLYQAEPKGVAERKKALDATADVRARLARTIVSPSVPPLTPLTASLLFDRALVAVESGEREVALRMLDDAAVFAPGDARVKKLMAREAGARGPLDLRDLEREGLVGAE
jgi:hypothetical protein